MCVVYFWYSGSKEHQMSDQSNKPVVRNQSVSEARQGLFDEMAAASRHGHPYRFANACHAAGSRNLPSRMLGL